MGKDKTLGPTTADRTAPGPAAGAHAAGRGTGPGAARRRGKTRVHIVLEQDQMDGRGLELSPGLDNSTGNSTGTRQLLDRILDSCSTATRQDSSTATRQTSTDLDRPRQTPP